VNSRRIFVEPSMRACGLFAIAVMPLISGIGETLTDPVTLGPAYHLAMLICAALMTVAAVIAALTIPSSYTAIRDQTGTPPNAEAGQLSPIRVHCSIGAPPQHPSPTPR
jgi:hypothetical protein